MEYYHNGYATFKALNLPTYSLHYTFLVQPRNVLLLYMSLILSVISFLLAYYVCNRWCMVDERVRLKYIILLALLFSLGKNILHPFPTDIPPLVYNMKLNYPSYAYADVWYDQWQPLIYILIFPLYSITFIGNTLLMLVAKIIINAFFVLAIVLLMKELGIRDLRVALALLFSFTNALDFVPRMFASEVLLLISIIMLKKDMFVPLLPIAVISAMIHPLYSIALLIYSIHSFISEQKKEYLFLSLPLVIFVLLNTDRTIMFVTKLVELVTTGEALILRYPQPFIVLLKKRMIAISLISNYLILALIVYRSFKSLWLSIRKLMVLILVSMLTLFASYLNPYTYPVTVILTIDILSSVSFTTPNKFRTRYWRIMNILVFGFFLSQLLRYLSSEFIGFVIYHGEATFFDLISGYYSHLRNIEMVVASAYLERGSVSNLIDYSYFLAPISPVIYSTPIKDDWGHYIPVEPILNSFSTDVVRPALYYSPYHNKLAYLLPTLPMIYLYRLGYQVLK